MSGPLYGVRPPITDVAPPAPMSGVTVTGRVIRLDPGWYSLTMMAGSADRGQFLPAVRISLPPGPPGRRETVSISLIRGDGWMTASDEPTMIRVAAGGGEVLVTQYSAANDPAAPPPSLKLARLNPDTIQDSLSGAATQPPVGMLPAAAMPAAAMPSAVLPPAAEIVAHIEGVGDVDGKIGDWVGMRGSGRSVEGFGLTPRMGISTNDFDLRAVLGRDWLSPWIPGARFCGSRGLALPLRGFCIRLTPPAAARFEVACFARFVDGSEIGPLPAEAVCAAPSLAALEAFQFQVRSRLP